MSCDVGPLLAKEQVDGWTYTFGRSKQLKPEARQQLSYQSITLFSVSSFIAQKQQTHRDLTAQQSGSTMISHAAPEEIWGIKLSRLKSVRKWNVFQPKIAATVELPVLKLKSDTKKSYPMRCKCSFKSEHWIQHWPLWWTAVNIFKDWCTTLLLESPFPYFHTVDPLTALL